MINTTIAITTNQARHPGHQHLRLVPGRERTFALESSRDMLTKLAWEIDALDRHIGDGQDLAEATYWATNAGTTAWHIVDWAWFDLTDPVRVTLGNKYGLSLTGLKGQKRFEEFIATQAELKTCRAIAHTAKHAVLKPSLAARFEKIQAEVSIGATVTLAGRPTPLPYGLLVKVDGVPEEIVPVLRRASAWWESFIRTNGIGS